MMASSNPTRRFVPKNVNVFMHSISQPATAILGYLEILRGNHHLTPADQERMLANCHASAVQMGELLRSWYPFGDTSGDETRIG